MSSSLFQISERHHAGMLFMTELARQGDTRLSVEQAATKIGISVPYLEEIVALLRKAGLIEGRKGPGGGYVLAKPAQEITAEAILLALEGPVSLVACQGTGCPASSVCSSQRLWHLLQSRIITTLRELSLAEMIQPSV